MSNYTPYSANDVANMVLTHEAEVIDSGWYRNSSMTRKLLLTVTIPGEVLPRKILIPEGSHELYESFAKVS